MAEHLPTYEMPGCIKGVSDEDTINLNAGPIEVEGCHLVPAGRVVTGNESGERNFVLVMLSLGDWGLYNAFTPAGARAFAAAIIRGADQADAELAAKAGDAIAAARKRGGE